MQRGSFWPSWWRILPACYVSVDMDLGLRLSGSSDACASVLAGADALDRPLEQDAELTVTEMSSEAFVLGALQRGHGAPEGAPLVRRASGGALVRVGPGTIHVVLALASTSAIFPCDAARLDNRYVRPLLRALTKGGATAAYFGRDWVSVKHRPAAAVGFAHDARTGRAVFEAFVAVVTPFAVPRPSFLGKTPGTLETICVRAFDPAVLARAIADAYVAAAGGTAVELPARSAHPASSEADAALRAEPPWTACVEEVIGPVCAGHDASGVLRLGGDFMASRDAVAHVEASVAALPGATRETVGQIVNDAFRSGGAAIEGVRDLASVRDALFEAQKRT
jgi:hypothetical protein